MSDQSDLKMFAWLAASARGPAAALGRAGVGKRFVVAPLLFLRGRAVIMSLLPLGDAWPRSNKKMPRLCQSSGLIAQTVKADGQ